MTEEEQVNELAQAIYTINRHAKTALEPQHLYYIKKESIHKLLRENKAKKIGLHFSDNPKYSNQHSTLLIKVSDYYFHIPPSKEDFNELKHLGKLDHGYRNPRTKMSLSKAKRIVYQYINWKPKQNKKTKHKHYSSYYTPSSLGKMEWSPTRRNRR